VAKKTPLRKCIGCGQMMEKKSLIRIIKTSDDEIMLDPTGKLNGRGAYICKDSNCLKQAIKTKGLDRAFKMQISKEIYDKLGEELIKLEDK
jgi:predicted RNA-binding protein YlxR (DUF448 family)